jgi:serine phosphatase RsbU (regulator of sigma subunit)
MITGKLYFLRIIFILFFFNNVLAQSKYDKSFYLIDVRSDFVFEEGDKHLVDSLLNIYHVSKNDTVHLRILQFFSESLNSEFLWTSYNRYLYKYTINKNDSLYKDFNGTALNNLGYEAQYIKNDLEQAKKYYHLSYDIFKSVNNSNGLATELNNLAYIYQHEGDIEKSIELYAEAGKIFEKQNQALGITSIYINLGDIYFNNNDFNKAEEFFKKALVYAIKTKQQQVIANVYNQLGVINANQNKIVPAINYFNKGIFIYKNSQNYSRVAVLSMGLANVYSKINDTVLFRKTIFLAYEYAKICPDIQVKSRVYDHIAFYYLTKKDDRHALIFADSAYFFAKKITYPKLIFDASLKLSGIYKRLGNYNLAYDFLYEANTMKDSISSDVSKKSIIKSQYKFEYDKKEIQLGAEQDKKDAIRKQEKKQQQIVLLLTISALLIIAVFAFIAFKNYRKTKKQNLIINNQKLEVELKNEEITQQKDLVEEKQKEIIDSINYAKRIQQAVLTGADVWDKISKEHFILFKPKDIVSGDFYWAYNTPNNRSIFALADCTGHGVPGGFMSMLGNSFLNEIIVENKLFKANEILNRLRFKIINALEQKGGTQQKDGMDISLCVWNKIDNTLEFAGANNPLWLLRGKDLMEYKADKMPIGTYLETEVPFSSVVIQLQVGDIIYLSTDGYADQFGGPKGKKYKYKPLIESLIKNSPQDMGTQKNNLEIVFNDWKGKHEQVDDVSIIGIRV